MRGLGIAAAGLMAAALGAGAADAAIITVTVSGTLSSGFDQSGMFGAADTDLTGATFSIVQIVDTSLVPIVDNAPPTSEYVQGGWLYGRPSPGDATLTVNGVSVVAGDLAIAQLLATQSGHGESYAKQVIIGDHVTTENDLHAQLNFGAPLHLLDGWHSDCPVADGCSGGFSYSQYVFTTIPGSPDGGYLYANTGSFDIDAFDVSVAAAVPAPPSWAMMILGFGLAGSGLRRRRALAA
jgi:hypothetical protein